MWRLSNRKYAVSIYIIAAISDFIFFRELITEHEVFPIVYSTIFIQLLFAIWRKYAKSI